VDIQRAVRERDGNQCTFADDKGRRCSERRYITLEHKEPFALGGPPSVDNISLLCWAHNQHAARKAFGEDHIERKRAEAGASKASSKASSVDDKALSALVKLGFPRKDAQQALRELEAQGAESEVEPLLRSALALLTPT
jgi:hypothetical protein